MSIRKAAAPARSAPHPARLLMQVRQLHVYFGMLIAPSVLFFAATGVLQIYSLHEAHPGYTPPPLIEKLGMTHKDQEFALGHKGPPPGAKRPGDATGPGGPQAPHLDGPPKSAAAPGAPGPGPKRRGPSPATAALKAFFALVSAGLFASTLTGVWMALKHNKAKRACWLLLALGVVIPTALTLMTAG
jgi:hypothetical protein